MNVKQIEAKIDELDRVREEAIGAIGKQVYREQVAPFCKKYKLTFSSGMGSWCFWDNTDKQVAVDYYDSDVWIGTRLQELKNVSKILEIDCGNNSLGEYVPDYRGGK